MTDLPTIISPFFNGAIGSWYAFTSATLVRATPLIVIGLGFALALRAGALNIGAEGQFYAGAIAATWVGLHLAMAPSPVAIGATWIAAALAGALWMELPLDAVRIQIASGVNKFSLLAIPFFVLARAIMA